jgi:hypothetical protein
VGNIARAWFIIAALSLATACGGNGSDTGVPKLAGTRVPTAVIEPTATPVCQTESPLPTPATFPGDLLLPDDFRISTVETTPHLRIVGTTQPPIDPGSTAGPPAITGSSMARVLSEVGFTSTRNADVDGIDYSFSAPDGRSGHFNVMPVAGCAGFVSLAIELFWVTPASTSAAP